MDQTIVVVENMSQKWDKVVERSSTTSSVFFFFGQHCLLQNERLETDDDLLKLVMLIALF